MGDSRKLAVDAEKRFASGFRLHAVVGVQLRPGSILVLFGPSGSGKTTILRSLAGVERPDRGTIQFGGTTWFDSASALMVPPQRRRVGYVFQEAALFPHLTVADNVAYGLTSADRDTRTARVRMLLEQLEIPELAGRYPRELSGGQAQRVALARAVATGPRLLLLDEPFAALDAPARLRLRALLRQLLVAQGIPAVLVTHDRNDAIAVGDQMVVLSGGEVRQTGAVLDVFRYPADLEVARTVGVDSVLAARVERSIDGLVDLRVADVLLRAADVSVSPGVTDVFACIRAEDVTLERVAAPQASARNHLPGTILRIESDGALERVTVDCGFPLAALITRHAREELALNAGAPVVAAIKATAVHLVPRS